MNGFKRLKRPFVDAHVGCYSGIILRENGVAATRTKAECTNEVYRIQNMIVVDGVVGVTVIAAHEVTA